MSGFDALAHAFSTLATGGMGNHDSSFADFTPAAQYVATVFMLLGAHVLHPLRPVRPRRAAARSSATARSAPSSTIYLCLLPPALLVARVAAGAAIDETTVREVLFNLASVITTTGFASTDYSLWGPLAEMIFFCAMMICGCSGSTSGGPKVFRYQLLARRHRRRGPPAAQPERRLHPALPGRRRSPTTCIDSVIAFFMLFFLTLGLGAVALVLLGLDPVSAISGAAAMPLQRRPRPRPDLGPAGTYAPLPDAGEVGLLVPDAGRPARAHDRLRPLHRRLLARLRLERPEGIGQLHDHQDGPDAGTA